MLPILFRFGPVTLYTYGIFLALAFFWFLYIAWRSLRITSYKEEEIFDVIFISLGIGLFLGRVAFMAFHVDELMKKGFMLFFAVHLYPGVHGLTMIIAALTVLMVLIRDRKYGGAEIVAYIIPAICVALAIVNMGALFAGNVVGVVTDFPVRIKYAFYDGLRHVPSLYLSIIFAFVGFGFSRLLIMARRGKIAFTVMVALFIWIVATAHVLVFPMKDTLTFMRSSGFRLYELYASILTLLTAFIFLMYHWRAYFFGFIHLGRPGKIS